MNRRKIIWSFWYNPFGEADEEFLSEEDADILGVSNWNHDDDGTPVPVKCRPVMPTSMGFVPIQPFKNFSHTFKFWVGDTNFDITSEVKEKIETTPGVEILDVISRYCFRISVGKAFDSRDVKEAIQKALNATPPKKGEINPTDMSLDRETREKVSQIQAAIKSEFPYWAVYVMPNGEIDAAGANTKEGYDMHLELYRTAQELAGGVIYQYA